MARLERKRQGFIALNLFLATKAAERGDVAKAAEYLDIIDGVRV